MAILLQKLLINIATQDNQAENYKRLQQQALEIRDQILICFFTEKYSHTEKEQIKAIENQAAKFYNLASIFEETLKCGDLDTAKRMYSYMQSQLPIEFFYHILASLEETENDVYFNICDYFFEQDNNLYSIALRARMSEYKSLDNYYYNKLFLYALRGNFRLFAMFLKHGVDPDSIGLLNKGFTINLLQLLLRYSVAPKFAIELINMGASITPQATIKLVNATFILPNNLEVNKESAAIASRSIAGEYKTLPKDAERIHRTYCFIAFNPQSLYVIAYASQKADSTLVQRLLAQTPFIDLVRATFIFSDSSEVFHRFFYMSCFYGLHVCRNLEQLEAQQTSWLSPNEVTTWQDNGSPKRMAYVFYGSSAISENEMNNLRFMIAILNLQYKRMINDGRVREQDVVNKELLKKANYYTKLGNNHASNNNLAAAAFLYENALNEYNALLLLYALMPELSLQTQEFIKKIYGFMLKIATKLQAYGINMQKTEKLLQNYSSKLDLFDVGIELQTGKMQLEGTPTGQPFPMLHSFISVAPTEPGAALGALQLGSQEEQKLLTNPSTNAGEDRHTLEPSP